MPAILRATHRLSILRFRVNLCEDQWRRAAINPRRQGDAEMADQEHVERLKQGVSGWNRWREENPEIRPALRKAGLCGADLRDVNLLGADLLGAVLYEADLRWADLRWATLEETSLHEARLSGANLS